MEAVYDKYLEDHGGVGNAFILTPMNQQPLKKHRCKGEYG